ncbi:hypothetical protein [Spirochaeta dissipatitropha]
MDASTGILPIGNSLLSIQTQLQNLSSELPDFTAHFSQTEEFFIQLEDEIQIPRLPIHHDVREMRPAPEMDDALSDAIGTAISAVPGLFRGMNCFFLPQDPIKPGFYSLSRFQGKLYMTLIRLDLSFRPNQFAVIRQGTNDISSAYSCRRLYIEADILPVNELIKGDDRFHDQAVISRSISDTWIGESGRGYLIQGIWIDRDITKFLSKAISPPDTRMYPYFPLNCKYQAICHNLVQILPESRKQIVPKLHNFQGLLQDYIGSIQKVLKTDTFRSDLPLLKEIQQKIPRSWNEYLENVRLEPYLNENSQKEFRIHYEPQE